MKGRWRIGIVCSRYNSEYTDALLAAAEAEIGEQARTVSIRVPGAYEVPLVIQRLAKSRKFDALIALGLIWQGETDHADLIGGEACRACMGIALEFDIPVIFEILSVRTAAQARARCLGKKLNRGTEAAQTALEMAALRTKI